MMGILHSRSSLICHNKRKQCVTAEPPPQTIRSFRPLIDNNRNRAQMGIEAREQFHFLLQRRQRVQGETRGGRGARRAEVAF